jgi:hypothetical protein
MAISDGPKRQNPKGCLVLFFGLFFLMGSAFFYFIGIRPALKILEARDWPEVECRILSSKVGSHSGSKGGTTYSIDIVYEYERHGETYRSEAWDFLGGSSSGYDGKAEVVARYPAGSTSRCYVNPREPSEAVLFRGAHAGLLFGLIPLVFVAVGAGGITFSLRKPRPKPIRAAEPRRPLEEAELASGAVVLKPETTRGCRLVGAILVCLFWNGIVSIFVVQFFQKPEGCMGLFLLPFVAVGLALVGLVVYTLLAMFNPVPVIRASGRSVPLGGMLELEWELQGAWQRLGSLKLTIEGREEATYRRGTKTTTEKHVFETIMVFESGPEGDLRGGRAIVPVPRDAMPSFQAPNNKIVWSLKVHGAIRRWPDVDEQFPLTILPAEGEAGA